MGHLLETPAFLIKNIFKKVEARLWVKKTQVPSVFSYKKLNFHRKGVNKSWRYTQVTGISMNGYKIIFIMLGKIIRPQNEIVRPLNKIVRPPKLMFFLRIWKVRPGQSLVILRPWKVRPCKISKVRTPDAEPLYSSKYCTIWCSSYFTISKHSKQLKLYIWNFWIYP